MRRRRLRGAIDAASFGGFLIIIGYVWFAHPNIFSDIGDTFRRLAEEQVFRPSRTLVVPAYTFLFLLALRDVLLGALRAAASQASRRVVKEFFAAAAYAGIGYLMFQFSSGTLTGPLLILYTFLTAGILVVIYGAIGYTLERRALSVS
ncbi:MAG: hypothetical protein ACE5KH_00170 [Candidatus Geothermarchaeales archaeon]